METPGVTEEPMFVIQPDGNIRYLNEAAHSLFRTDLDDSIVGNSVFEYISSSYQTALLEQFEGIDSGDVTAMGLTVEMNLGSDDPHEFIALSTPVEWNGSEQIQLLLFTTNGALPTGLSARTMDASPIGITIDDATLNDEQVIYVNDGFCELTGYECEEILGQNCRVLQGEETDEATVAEIRQAIDAEEPITTELRNYRKDGTMFWNRLTISPIEDETGTVTHYLGFQEDISERKVFEQEKALFEMQADATEQAVFITDADGTIEYVNPAFERTTGYSADDAIGENPRLLKSEQQDEEFYQELWETITAGEVWEAELTNQRKSGERYRIKQKIVPITSEDGELTHFVAIEEDVTGAQFIDEVLSVMDRVLRHNVRNSVTAISGYADLLDSDLDETDHRVAVQTIREHAKKLEKLSNETRTIRELFHRRHAQHSLAIDAITGFIEARREQHPNAVIELTIDVESGVEIQNGSLLQLAIDEALENAIVHTDQDDPFVEVTVEQIPNQAEIQIEIADTGPGIPDDQWNVITSGGETQLAHTTGLGLWLIYWTLTALGGTVERTENEPRGTILTYRVPINAGDHSDQWDVIERL